jgi:hypothetical protein
LTRRTCGGWGGGASAAAFVPFAEAAFFFAAADVAADGVRELRFGGGTGLGVS